MILHIWEVKEDKKRYLSLLLLADEQEDMVDRYLERGTMYVLEDGGIRAECVVTDEGGVLELKNLAVEPAYQGRGYGRRLIAFLLNTYAGRYRELQVGTGDSPATVPFYEKCGFVPFRRIPSFFTDHYDHPIYDGGVRLRDMVCLRQTLSAPAPQAVNQEEKQMYYFTTCPSPVGQLTLASDGESLTGLWLEGQKYFGATMPEDAVRRDGLPVFSAAQSWLERYFAGEKPQPAELPLRPAGGEFRQRVWKLLCGIPYGQVTTYGALARELEVQTGQAASSQAVGGAVGHNPISIVIPCHRVVGSGGNLTGYAGGLDRKVRLLELEGADMSRLSLPKAGR